MVARIEQQWPRAAELGAGDAGNAPRPLADLAGSSRPCRCRAARAAADRREAAFPSQSSNDTRNEYTMMAMATIKLKLTMIEARLKVDRPMLSRSCARAVSGTHPVGARRDAQNPHRERRHEHHRAEQERGDRGVAEQRAARRRAEAARGAPPSGERRAPPIQPAVPAMAAGASSPPLRARAGAGGPRRAPGTRRPRRRRPCRSRRRRTGSRARPRARRPRRAAARCRDRRSATATGPRRTTSAEHEPSREPASPSSAPSPSSASSSSPRVAPSARNRPRDSAPRSTDKDCVENTRNAPVHRETSASMLRLTR